VEVPTASTGCAASQAVYVACCYADCSNGRPNTASQVVLSLYFGLDILCQLRALLYTCWQVMAFHSGPRSLSARVLVSRSWLSTASTVFTLTEPAFMLNNLCAMLTCPVNGMLTWLDAR
jgi:hypothetical protein